MSKLISKHQHGTNRGGLVPHQESGTWGNRGQGNELTSAIENGLSGIWNGVKWVGDKVANGGDYIDRGLSYTIGLIPGGQTAQEAYEEAKRRQNPQYETFTASNGAQYPLAYYEDLEGNKQYLPMTGTPPMLPSMPANSPQTLIDIYGRLKKLRNSWIAGERYYIQTGRTAEEFAQTSVTARKFNQFLKEFNEGVKALGHSIKGATEDVQLFGKLKEAFQTGKAIALNDMRAVNRGRPAVKRYLIQIENALTKDSSPWAVKLYEKLRLKREALKDKQALKAAEEKIFREYATRRNMEHQLKQLGWYE